MSRNLQYRWLAVLIVLAALATVTIYGASQARSATPTRHLNHPTRVCARAAFLADAYAHTHTGAQAEHRAVQACARLTGGF